MKKFWLVFKHEYLRQVLRKRFLIAVLSMPLFVVVMMGVGVFSAILAIDTSPVGYIDQSGLLANAILPPQEDGPFRNPELVAYTDETKAVADLDTGEIQAVYIIGPDYLQTGNVRILAKDNGASAGGSLMQSFLQINLLRGQSKQVADRILEGPMLTFKTTDNSREMQENNIMGIILPILTGIIFIIAVNSSGGYLLQAVVEEKENRTMEIVITSVSPNQLMIGKVLGDLCVGLTQLGVWVGFALIGVAAAVSFFPLPVGQSIDWTAMILMLVTLLPAFVMVAAIMATIGATAIETREAQQIASLFTLPIVVPFWFATSIMTNPNGPIAVGLSFFPLTAPMALPMRAAFTNVPAWQVGLIIVLLLAVAAGALWLAGRAFRLGMLRYGKRLSWRELFSRTQAV